jgi:hypothetical protein
MEAKEINIDQFNDYVYNAIIDDEEIIEYYDRSVGVKSTLDAINNIVEKIKNNYSDAIIYGIIFEGKKIGYFVYRDNLLVSFGISVKHRNKETLTVFWEQIKNRLGNNFHSLLYSHNIRAIEWLKKSGMKILFDHITVLSYN